MLAPPPGELSVALWCSACSLWLTVAHSLRCRSQTGLLSPPDWRSVVRGPNLCCSAWADRSCDDRSFATKPRSRHRQHFQTNLRQLPHHSLNDSSSRRNCRWHEYLQMRAGLCAAPVSRQLASPAAPKQQRRAFRAALCPWPLAPTCGAPNLLICFGLGKWEMPIGGPHRRVVRNFSKLLFGLLGTLHSLLALCPDHVDFFPLQRGSCCLGSSKLCIFLGALPGQCCS